MSLFQRLNPNHNHYRKYTEATLARGDLVVHVLGSVLDLKKAKIVDIGCGAGGASVALAKAGANVLAIDPDGQCLEAAKDLAKRHRVRLCCLHLEGEKLNDLGEKYDAVLLLDVLEHVADPDHVLYNAKGLLDKGGWLYLSTPNRWSPLNLLSDPHYSLPFVALLKRRTVRTIVADILGWHSQQKKDFAELFDLHFLHSLFKKHGFEWEFVNRPAVAFALENPHCIWTKNWHLFISTLAKKYRADRMLLSITNDVPGAFNKWLNPTWYILARRNQS
jgi:2-polyprenyl-3-methyl-5-hydroxy-6-metoxy-1,4-benzoquinol methylase